MLVALDLDFTLWDCGGLWIDHTSPPFNLKKGSVFDSRRRRFSLYPDTRNVLDFLSTNNIPIAAVSRTHEPGWALEVLELYKIDHYFDYKEIYPGSKIQHFNALRKKSDIPFSEMFFFDDEERNIKDAGSLGITSVYIPDGITLRAVKKAINI